MNKQRISIKREILYKEPNRNPEPEKYNYWHEKLTIDFQ